MINIDKAIRNLEAGRKDAGMIPSEEYTDTINLAIVALRRIKTMRHTTCALAGTLLPGERFSPEE